MSTLRIVVADEGEARFYDAGGLTQELTAAGRITDPNAHLHDRDLKSDRPGRLFTRAPGVTRRGAVTHHATGGENSPRRHETQLFAHQIAAQLEAGRAARAFEQLVIVAGPPFLGALRAALPKALSACVALEIPRDLVHQGEQALRAHLDAAAARE
jgi:protein required for attachment to host cells